MINRLKSEFIEILYNEIEKTICIGEDYRLLLKILSDIEEYFKQTNKFQTSQ